MGYQLAHRRRQDLDAKGYRVGDRTGSGFDAADATTDLATGTVTGSSIQLSWTAPGDDGAVGTATTYDVRYSTSTIIEGNWASATLATGEPSPQVAGSAESFTVTGLSASTTYYFAIKTSDEIPNWSAISNVPSAATLEAHSAGCRHGPRHRDGDGVEHPAVLDCTRRRRSHRDRHHLRCPLLHGHDQRGQLGLGHAGDGRAFATDREEQ